MKNKILLSLALILLTMLLFPVLVINFASADAGMALCFILFFIINPALVLALTVISLKDLKKLFWLPLFSIIAFPLLFSIEISGVVWDLYIYSAFYLFAALITLLICYLTKKMFRNKKRRRTA